MSRNRLWTATERQLMRDLYPDVPAADIAALLARPVGQVHQCANRMGLGKSAAFMASDRSGRIQRGHQHPSMIASRFQAGITPWNKGVKGSTGTQEGCRATQFKPGRPAEAARNYVPIGSLRISKDGYLERKVTDNPALMPARRWVAEHRLVWEAAHGPIPSGHIVVFRKGAPRAAVASAIKAEHLECITRAENAQRNHPRNISPELAKLYQIKGAITRQVNRISREAMEARQ